MLPLQHCMPPVVAQLLRRQPLSPAKVALAWRAAVGDGVNRASTVKLADHGTLLVHAVDQHWRREITRSSPVIIERLRALLGSTLVTRITVDAPSEGRAPRKRGVPTRRRRPSAKKR